MRQANSPSPRHPPADSSRRQARHLQDDAFLGGRDHDPLATPEPDLGPLEPRSSLAGLDLTGPGIDSGFERAPVRL